MQQIKRPQAGLHIGPHGAEGSDAIDQIGINPDLNQIAQGHSFDQIDRHALVVYAVILA